MVPPDRFADPETIRKVLGYARTVAVVGLAPNPARPSHGVARYLQSRGLRVVPVNPNASEVLGERSYPSLRDVPFSIDLVDVFRQSSAVAGIVDQAIQVRARGLWLQLGVIDVHAAERAAAAGLDVVMDRCLAVEHRRYGSIQ
jgi:predicted CoA-binding protein